MSKLPAPTKGVKPPMTGVKGQLVDAVPSEILFGERRNPRQSPYDPLLIQLRDAGAGKYLKFDDLRARASVYARAKKLGIKVLFGEQGNTLWVALGKVELKSEGQTDAPPAKTVSDLVLDAIDAKRHTAGEITSYLRSNGVGGAGISQVDGILSNLARQSKVKLLKNHPGADGERWGRR